MGTIKTWLSSAALIAVATGCALAQDPPSRVARLKYISGSVSFQPSTVDQWTGATLNYPMTTGDKLYTDQGARAEMRIAGDSVRLNSGTNFQYLNLDDQHVQMSITSGSLNLNVRRLYQGETWEVDTPDGAVTITQTGDYRIDADANRNATIVTIRGGGAAAVYANQGSFNVYSQQTAYFDASGQPSIQAASAPDQFDAFCDSRGRLDDVTPS